MRIGLLPGVTNVVRFPIERRVRPSLDILRDIKPDAQEVKRVAEAFFLDMPLGDVRAAADREMAEHILNHVRPEPGGLRRLVLDGLLKPLVDRGVDLCRRAYLAAEAAETSAYRLYEQECATGGGLEAYRAEQARTANKAARLLVDAYIAAEQAEGAARAIDLAKRGEEWTPFEGWANKESPLADAAPGC